jgi:regulatory protein
MTCRGNVAVFNMMKEITALTQQKNDSNRVNVFIDGSFSFGVSKISGVSLRVGQKISDKEIIELINDDSFEKAFQSALHYLSFRNRSENEVRLNLAWKGFFENDIIKVIDCLKSHGYLDDGNFAKEWVENRSASKPRGRRLLAYELKQKKVNSDMIAVALQSLPNESVLALKAARKIVPRYEKMDFDIFNKKVTGFLIRRGFDFEVVREVRKILWEEVQQKIDR